MKTSYTVDFNHRGERYLCLKTVTMYLPEVGGSRILGIKIPRRINVTIHKIWMQLDDCPKALVVNQPNRLFMIRIGTRYQTEFNKLKIEGRRYAFDVVFDLERIQDVSDPNLNNAVISGSLWAQNTEDGVPKLIQEFEVDLSLIKATPIPHYRFQLTNELLGAMEYVQRKVLMGWVSLESEAPFAYSQALDCELNIKFDQPFMEGLVSFGETREIEQTNPARGASLGGVIEEDRLLLSDASIDTNLNGQMTIRNLLPENEVRVPVYMDLAQTGNPLETVNYSATLGLEMAIDGHRVHRSQTLPFQIRPDSRRTELLVVLEREDRLTNLENEDDHHLEDRFHWNPQGEGRVHILDLRLGNHAENGEGVVYIRDFILTPSLAEESTSSLIPANGIDLNHVFTLDDDPLQRVSPSGVFPNTPKSWLNLALRFRHDAIQAIPDDIAKVRLSLSFRYLVLEGDPEQNQVDTLFSEQGQDFNCRFNFYLERNLGGKWLALDFGTSAIVAAFDDSDMDLELLNLQKPLENHMRRLNKGGFYNPDEIAEFGSRFLASNVLLNFEKALYTDKLEEDLVCLSAPVVDQLGDFRYNLPYLKALIGGDQLPNLDERLNTFAYKLVADTEEVIQYADRPLETKDILANTYRQVLHDFIGARLAESKLNKHLNKLVLTVPNTFTPKHTGMIRDLFQDKFPFLKKEYTSFVSESDAIAYYYLANWGLLNGKRDESNRRGLWEDAEYVLVYDMGAGTLDLTYLCIKPGEEDTRQVTILGRLGKTTAGNYLDYILAKAIHMQHEQLFNFPIFGKTSLGRADQMRLELKHYIRNTLKPALNRDDTFDLAADLPNLVTDGISSLIIDTAFLRNSGPMREFIQSNTHVLFENFFTLFGTIDGLHYRQGNLPMDTVIFSGRSVQINVIKDAIETALRDWCGEDIHKVDLGDQSLGLNEDNLKSAVVHGAFQYAVLYRDERQSGIRLSGNNLFARYGIIYKDPQFGGTWLYRELLNPNTRPTNPAHPEHRDGMLIFTYDTDQFDADPANDGKTNYLDLSNAPVIYLVQSYARDTERDWNQRNTEYITVMARVNVGELGLTNRRRVKVRLQIDRANEMRFRIGNQEHDPKAPIKIDVDGSETFRNSMWPYMEVI